MNAITGVVQKMSSKPVTTKFGTKATFSINVDGEWYKCGFTKPKCNEGDTVEFSYTEGTYGNEVDAKTIVVSGGKGAAAPIGAPKSASEGATRPAFGGKGVFPIPPLDGQRAIVRQNSVTNAVALLKDHLNADKKMSMMDKAAEIVACARMFEAYSCGDLDMAKATEMAKAKAAKPTEPSVEDVAF